MRQHQICIPTGWLISESKARIDHPEDLVFDEGSAGAKRALDALVHAAEAPHAVTIKWDGSPAVIFGRDDGGFFLTDKSGFASKKPGGIPRTASELSSMLFMRKPDEPKREVYSKSMGGLFGLLQNVVPDDFTGYLKGDVLWTSRPPTRDGNYVFTPNKVEYSIPVDSELGKLIGRSKVGIALHTRLDGPDDHEGSSIRDLNTLGLKPSADVVIMGPEIKDLESTKLPSSLTDGVRRLIDGNQRQLDAFLDRATLAREQISDLPAKMKSYAAHMAGIGRMDYENAQQGFRDWLQGPSGKVTDRKRGNMLNHITQHGRGYASAWAIASALAHLKDHIRRRVDSQVGTNIKAQLRGTEGHEGFVADTPAGKIKLVNRPHFMRKDTGYEVS